MPQSLDKITIKGFKSIRALEDFELSNLNILFNGPKVTEQIESVTRFGPNGYRFKLTPTADEAFIIIDEARYDEGGTTGWWEMGSGQATPELLKDKDRRGAAGHRNVAS
ncbi:MAG: hypothetical protein V1844_16400 [Pseudomonadota bacterium]